MTQPDQYFPDTAVNALSFADYASTTQDDWEDQIKGGVGSHFNIAELAFSTLLNFVQDIFDNLTDLIWNLLNNTGAVLGTISRNLISGLNGIIDNIIDFINRIVGGFLGWFGIDFTPDDAQEAATSASTTIAAHTAALARLEGGLPVVATFDFSQQADATSLPSPWNVTYTGDVAIGTWGISGGAAQFVGGPPGGVNTGYGRTALGIHSTAQSPGDRQRVGAVFSSIPQSQNGQDGRNFLICRSDGTVSNYVGADLSRNQIQLYYVAAGVKTIWATTSFTFKANNAYYLECGVGLFDRQYRVVNGDGTVLLSYTEVGTSSLMGASYRYAGAGAANRYYDDIFRAPEYGRAARMDLWIFQEN